MYVCLVSAVKNIISEETKNMKKCQKISILILVSMIVMSLFFACGPNGGEDNNNSSAVEKPTIIPEGGEITSNEPITLATEETGDEVKIFYTTDGTEPTNQSPSKKYISPFKLNEGDAIVVKAITYNGTEKSEVAKATFKVKTPPNDIKVVCTCTDDPIVAGSKVTVEITSNNFDRVEVYQVEEGKDLAKLGNAFDVPLNAELSIGGNNFGKYKLRAYRAGEDVSTSELYGESEAFEVKLAKPTTTSDAELFLADKISLATAVTIEGVEIRYTLDGNDPTKESNKYEGEFEHGKSAGDTFTLKAKTFVGEDSSDLFEMVFTVVDGDILLSENFNDKTDLNDYTVVSNELITEGTVSGWIIKEYDGDKAAVVPIDLKNENFKNDSRLELGEFDLSSYASSKISFDFKADYDFFVTDEYNGGDHVTEGGMDIKLVVKEGAGEWTMVWHEADTLQEGNSGGKATVDLSAYVGAGHTAVKIAFWVIGEDGDVSGVDNIKLISIN